MDNWNKATLKKVTWKEIRKDVAKVNGELAKIIDEIDPNSKYALFDISYPFGSEPLKNGDFYLPDPKTGNLLALSDSRTDPELQESLNYNLWSNPVSIILENDFELFIPFEKHTIPLFNGLISAGRVFGTWRVLSSNTPHVPAFLWHMTAGARSFYTLSKISDSAGHNRLKRIYNLNSELPKKLLDHWRLFKEMANHEAFGEKWSARILFFSKEWFEKLRDPAWIKLRTYLLQSAWDGSEFWRNQFMLDLIFSVIQDRRNMKPNPYIMDTVKHLLTVAVGAVPGFAPALDNRAGPVERLQEILKNDYRLEYAPVIMQPTFFDLYNEKGRPVYYSLEYPCMMEFSPSSRVNANKIVSLSDIHYLLNKCLSALVEEDLKIAGTPLYDLMKLAKFDFFHTKINGYSAIRNSTNIPMEDNSFLEHSKNCSGLEFPINCSFIKGCIRISH
jgi:hypothetical protein